jgi:hypothetical protein
MNPEEIERRFERIESALERLTDVQAMQGKNLETLIGVVSQLAAGQANLNTALLETQGKLDALIHIVDQWIREHGNGDRNK